MSPLTTVAVSTRRLLAKRPWIYWLVVAVVAVAVAGSVVRRVDRVDARRAAWGETVTVLVADQVHHTGDAVRASPVDVPRAVAPPNAITGVDGAVARQAIGTGEIVSEADVVATDSPQALIPAGWLAVPIVESPRSGARLGDRVRIASDGVVVAPDAQVVGVADEVTLVAVPDDVAPLVAAAADGAGATLLLVP